MAATVTNPTGMADPLATPKPATQDITSQQPSSTELKGGGNPTLEAKSPIFSPDYVSTKYTKSEADAKFAELRKTQNPEFDQNGVSNVTANNLDESEIIRIARGIIKPKADTTSTPAPTSTTGTPAPGATTTSTPTAVPTSDTSGLTKDAGTTMLEDATKKYSDGLLGLQGIYAQQKAEDIDAANQKYQAQQALLAQTEGILRDLNDKKNAVIGSAADAQKAEETAALDKAEKAVQLQKEETAKAYQDMLDAQALANKRANVRKETALGVLGGSFTTAGVADIEDTIMQGELALRSISKDADLKSQGFTNQVLDLQNTYKVNLQKIDQWKAEQINNAYDDLERQIVAIQQQKETSEEDKINQIQAAGEAYNKAAASLTADSLQAQYNLAKDVVTRSDNLQALAAEQQKQKTADQNQQRDDARTALQNLLNTVPAETFSNLNSNQKLQLEALEAKAGYPVGLIEQGQKTFKEEAADQKEIYQNASIDVKQQMVDLKAKMGDKVHYSTDTNGNVTATIYDPNTNQMTTQQLGRIGTAQSQFSFGTDANGDVTANNRFSGTSNVAPGSANAGGTTGIPHDQIQSATIGGKQVQAQPVFLSALQKADADYFAATGQHIKINESYRNNADQAAAYDRYQNGTGGLAAPPGQSFHGIGLAIDLPGDQVESAKPYLAKYGIVNGLQGDMGHFSMGEMNPGVFNGGTTSGGTSTSSSKPFSFTVPSNSITDLLGIGGKTITMPAQSAKRQMTADEIIAEYHKSVGLSGGDIPKTLKAWIKQNPAQAQAALERTQGLQEVKDQKDTKALTDKTSKFEQVFANWK